MVFCSFNGLSGIRGPGTREVVKCAKSYCVERRDIAALRALPQHRRFSPIVVSVQVFSVAAKARNEATMPKPLCEVLQNPSTFPINPRASAQKGRVLYDKCIKPPWEEIAVDVWFPDRMFSINPKAFGWFQCRTREADDLSAGLPNNS